MDQLLTFCETLGEGLFVTVVVTIGAAFVAIPVSLIGGLLSQSRLVIFRAIAASYVAVFRGTSAVVQLFWVYYALPLIGISFGAMLTGIVVLGLNTAAYGAEIVRGAMNAVPHGQREAAISLDFTRRQITWRIILPQAIPIMLPSFNNLLVELLKNSALVSLITLADLTFQGQAVLRGQFPGQTLTIFALLLAVYFLLAQVITRTFHILEERFSPERDVAKEAA